MLVKRKEVFLQRAIPARARPLSPHLKIYKAQYSSRLSISHRVSGAALGFVLRLLLTILSRRSFGVSYLGSFVGESWFVRLIRLIAPLRNGVRLCRRLSLCYHAVNGVRHLVWDSGKLLDKETRNRSARIVRTIALTLTTIVYFGWRNFFR